MAAYMSERGLRMCSLHILMLAAVLLGTSGAAPACEELPREGPKHQGFLPYRMELELVRRAELDREFSTLDAMDLDLLILYAHRLPLREWLERPTYEQPPRKYSSLAPIDKLARLKKLLEEFHVSDAGAPAESGAPRSGTTKTDTTEKRAHP